MNSATISLAAAVGDQVGERAEDREQVAGLPRRLEPGPPLLRRTAGRGLDGHVDGTPPRDHRAASRYASRSSASSSRAASGDAGPLWAGIEKFGVRWKTVSSAACSAMSGIDWMPDEPVPMTPTRLPVKSTPSCGQRLVK